MSSCCNKPMLDFPETNSDGIKNKRPKNFIKRFFWKIGKSESEKMKNNPESKKSCCS